MSDYNIFIVTGRDLSDREKIKLNPIFFRNGMDKVLKITSYDQLEGALNTHGVPDYIHIDFELFPEHKTESLKYVDDMINFNFWVEYGDKGDLEENGFDCLSLILDKCQKDKIAWPCTTFFSEIQFATDLMSTKSSENLGIVNETVL